MHLFLKKILGYILLVWILNLGIGYYLSTYETVDLQKNKQFFPALRWADYYSLGQDPEVVVLGSSHAYRAYNPEIMATALDKSVFNFGSSAQSPITSYYVLKEVVQRQKPKLVILDLYFMVFTADDQLKNGRFNWSAMKSSPVKREFLLDGFSFSNKVSLLLFPAYAYKTHLRSKINKLLGKRYLPAFKGTYQGNGFVSNPDTLSIEKLKYNNQFDVFKIDLSAITEKNMDYLKKIINYCAAEKIQLVLTAAPMPAVTVGKIDDYKSFHELFNKYAQKGNIPFFDYNINRIEALNDSTHYYDDDHLNAAGAVIFSKALSRDLKSIN